MILEQSRPQSVIDAELVIAEAYRNSSVEPHIVGNTKASDISSSDPVVVGMTKQINKKNAKYAKNRERIAELVKPLLGKHSGPDISYILQTRHGIKDASMNLLGKIAREQKFSMAVLPEHKSEVPPPTAEQAAIVREYSASEARLMDCAKWLGYPPSTVQSWARQLGAAPFRK